MVGYKVEDISHVLKYVLYENYRDISIKQLSLSNSIIEVNVCMNKTFCFMPGHEKGIKEW